MRVILQETVANLGKVGELVNVKSGFARNFLIPYGKAVQANEENIKNFEARKAELLKKEAEKLAAAQKRADQLAETSVTLEAKASEEGKLFGSITPREIAEAATAAGVELSKSEVKLPEGPIRQTGEFEVNAVLHTEVNATFKVIVAAQK